MWLLWKLFGRGRKGEPRTASPHQGEMSIRCAWCGGPIRVGEPITLYTPSSDKVMLDRCWGQKEFEFVKDEELGFPIPAHAVVYNRKPLQLVGCLRVHCADSGGDRAGFWVVGEDGKPGVRRVMTAYELIVNSNMEEVVVSNVADPRQAVDLKQGNFSMPVARTVK